MKHHVAECPGCMAQLRDAEQAIALLALSAPPVAAPPELRDRLLAAIEPEPAAAARPRAGAAERRAEPRIRSRSPGWWPRFARIAAPVLAVAVIGLVAWNVSLRNSLTDTQDIVYGSATSAALPQVGTVFVDADGQATLVANASSAPSGKTYQAWVIPPGRQADLGGTLRRWPHQCRPRHRRPIPATPWRSRSSRRAARRSPPARPISATARST